MIARIAALLFLLHATLAAALSPSELRGRELYQAGRSTGPEVVVTLGNSDLEMPAALFPCANCHGRRGEGSREGGLQAPSLRWSVLTAAATSQLTGARRNAYSESSLEQAIRLGLNPSRGALHAGMPNYRMAREQMADLIAYLHALGTERDLDRGVGEHSIRIGAALPLSGTLRSVGIEIQQMLQAGFDAINRRQGVYGRRLELVVRDSRGDAAGTLDALRRLVEDDQVFALAGSFEPAGLHESGEYLLRTQTPLVGPSTLAPRVPRPPNPWVFYLLPGFEAQARTLVSFVAGRRANTPRIALVYSANPFDLDGAAGFKDQASIERVAVTAESQYAPESFDAAGLVAALQDKNLDYLAFFGNPANFLALARAMESALPDVRLLSSAVVAGDAAFQLSPAMAERTALAYPGLPPAQTSLGEFLETARHASIEVRDSAYQRSAYAAVQVLAEALKRAGHDLTPLGLVQGLESLHDFRTGVLPPVSFRPNRRIGALGSCIVAVNPAGKRYVPLSEWMTPETKP